MAMAIRKCERCDLNYVKEGEKYCKVCQKILDEKKPAVEKAELCPSCGERLVAKGYELCKVCLADIMDTVESLEDENNDVIDPDITPADMEISEIDIDDDEDVPDEIKSELEDELDEEDFDVEFAEDDEIL